MTVTHAHSPRRHTAETATGQTQSHTHRRHTADKPNWDGRTKPNPAPATLVCSSNLCTYNRKLGPVLDTDGPLQETRSALGRSQLSATCSHASSDAGSVLDSVLGTPRHRTLTKLQHQHTLQAVASRLQHVHSSDLSQSEHIFISSPPASIQGDIDLTSCWVEEQVSCLSASCYSVTACSEVMG